MSGRHNCDLAFDQGRPSAEGAGCILGSSTAPHDCWMALHANILPFPALQQLWASVGQSARQEAQNLEGIITVQGLGVLAVIQHNLSAETLDLMRMPAYNTVVRQQSAFKSQVGTYAIYPMLC